jgi:hypothetical protein
MDNKIFYKEELEKCAKIRHEINEEHWKDMDDLKCLFKQIFEERDDNDYILIKNLRYYQGGYPSENTPSRLHSMLDKFIKAILYYYFLGNTDASDYLKAAGIEIKVSKPIDNLKIDVKKLPAWFQEKWSDQIKEDIPDNTKEFFDVLLTQGEQVQSIICNLADEIKVNEAPKVEEQCKVKKPHFINSVNMKYKKMMKRKIDKDIGKQEDNINSITRSLEVLKEENIE